MAQRDKALLDLQRTSAYAPVTGTVTQSTRLQVGQMMVSGLPAVEDHRLVVRAIESLL